VDFSHVPSSHVRPARGCAPLPRGARERHGRGAKRRSRRRTSLSVDYKAVAQHRAVLIETA